MKNTIKRVIISGKVQGVSYRAWTITTASALNLSGWVRNLNDGNVEAIFSGLEENIDKMIEKCYSGPPMAKISSITIYESEEAVPKGFIQKPTF